MSKIRGRILVRAPATKEGMEAMATAIKVTDDRHGAENVHPVPRWKNQAQEAWHRMLHVAGIHWYIYTEVYDLETGELEPKGSVCWLCPDELAALRRRRS